MVTWIRELRMFFIDFKVLIYSNLNEQGYFLFPIEP